MIRLWLFDSVVVLEAKMRIKATLMLEDED